MRLFFSDDAGSFDEINRELNGHVNLWINGKLGYLINLKYIGIIPLAALISIIFIYIQKINLNDVVLNIMVILITLFGLFISIIAYFNYRYISSLFPMFLFTLVWISNYISEVKSKRLFVGTLFGIQLLFFTFSFIGDFLPKYSSRLFSIEISAGKQQKTVDDVYEFINRKIPLSEKILVNNLPQFYTKTQHHGVYYWSGDNNYFNQNGENKIEKTMSAEDTYLFIKNTLHCNYILNHCQLENYNDTLKTMLEKHAELVAKKQNGELLYKLKL